MTTIKINNRKLQSGKNKNQNQMIDNLMAWIDDNKAALLNAAQQYYNLCGIRGCLNLPLTVNPHIPFKHNKFTFVTIDAYEEMQSEEFAKKVYDEAISTQLLTYDPSRQAVVCIWYGKLHIVTTLTGYLDFGAMMRQRYVKGH